MGDPTGGDDGLFRADGPSTYVPTAAATGPWDRRVIHGAAVAALFAGADR